MCSGHHNQWFHERYVVQESLLNPKGLWQKPLENYTENLSARDINTEEDCGAYSKKSSRKELSQKIQAHLASHGSSEGCPDHACIAAGTGIIGGR